MTSPNQFRKGLPAAGTYNYLNNAATSPTHEHVRAAVSGFEDDRGRRAERGWDDWMDAVDGVRQATSWFFECAPEEVAFTKNTSEGIGLVAAGIPWKRGDQVVTTDAEFPSNIVPWRILEAQGVEVRMVPSRNGLIDEADVERAITDRTRLVTFSTVAFSTGQRLDVHRLTKAAHEHGAQVLVDSIQGSGAVDTSFRKWDADFLACGGHKWMMAPLGVGVLLVRRSAVEALNPVVAGWMGREEPFDYGAQNTKMASTARKFESGNLNLAGLAGWRAAIGGMASVPDREATVLELTSRLHQRLSQNGLKPITPGDPKRRAGILSVSVKEVEDAVLHLRKRNVLVAARGPYVRFSPHFWNTRDEVDAAADLLVGFLRGEPNKGHRGPPPGKQRKPGKQTAKPKAAPAAGDAAPQAGRRRRRRRRGKKA